MAAQNKLMLSTPELKKLARLVGNHTAGSDRDMEHVFNRICILLDRQGIDYKTLPAGVQVMTGNPWPIIDMNQVHNGKVM